MIKIVLDQATMKFMSLCESITGATVKDCIIDDNLVLFIIKEGDIGKAIGKKGFNVKRLEHTLKKKVKMVEFNTEMGTFIGNLMIPCMGLILSRSRTYSSESVLCRFLEVRCRFRSVM